MEETITTTVEEIKEVVKDAKKSWEEEQAEWKEKTKAEILKEVNPFLHGQAIHPIEKEKAEPGIALARYVKAKAIAGINNMSVRDVAQRFLDASHSETDERIVKTLALGNFDEGGALVPEEFLNEVIPYLDNASVVRKAGARV